MFKQKHDLWMILGLTVILTVAVSLATINLTGYATNSESSKPASKQGANVQVCEDKTLVDTAGYASGNWIFDNAVTAANIRIIFLHGFGQPYRGETTQGRCIDPNTNAIVNCIVPENFLSYPNAAFTIDGSRKDFTAINTRQATAALKNGITLTVLRAPRIIGDPSNPDQPLEPATAIDIRVCYPSASASQITSLQTPGVSGAGNTKVILNKATVTQSNKQQTSCDALCKTSGKKCVSAMSAKSVSFKTCSYVASSDEKISCACA